MQARLLSGSDSACESMQLPSELTEIWNRSLHFPGELLALPYLLTNDKGAISPQNTLGCFIDSLHAGCRRVSPAFYSHNYVTLAPGESLHISVDFRRSSLHNAHILVLEGWNSKLCVTI